jgi:hypothetical protein
LFLKQAPKFAKHAIYKIKQACFATTLSIFDSKQALKFAKHAIYKIKQACFATILSIFRHKKSS